MRTPRGRMATRTAYLHFGLPAPRSPALDAPQQRMFDEGE
jgi:hypothetical protein